MLRRAAVLLLAAALAAAGLAARFGLESEGVQRVAAGLLYLPKGAALRAMSLGQEETLADLLYLWAIQYYSNYEDRGRYAFIDRIFRGAITELDPRFNEAYLVGALIMSIEARRPDLALRLYDKGIAAMPENWEIAFWAGWECYYQKDYTGARRYWRLGAERPGAPPQLRRHAARMLELAGDLWTALREYEELYEHPPDERTKAVAAAWIERLRTEIGLRAVDEALAAFRARYGRCAPDLAALRRAGLLGDLPGEIAGEPPPFVVDREQCRALPAPRRSFETAR